MKLSLIRTKRTGTLCILMALILIIGAAFSGCGVKYGKEPNENGYIQCTAIELMDLLNINVHKARKAYKGKDVELTGYIISIDHDKNTVNVGAMSENYEYILETVRCNITNDGVRSQISRLTHDDYVMVRGKVVSVNEFLGYTIDIESINLSTAPKDEG